MNQILPNGRRWRVMPRSVAVGFATGSPILTMTGVLPVQSLIAGLRLPARGGATRLTRITPHHHATAALITIPAHCFGKGLPETDLTVGADQVITLPGGATSAPLNGATADILVRPRAMQMPAGRLAAFGFHTRPHVADHVTLWELETQREDSVMAANLPFLSRACPESYPAGLTCH